jgi:hypothetical protein
MKNTIFIHDYNSCLKQLISGADLSYYKWNYSTIARNIESIQQIMMQSLKFLVLKLGQDRHITVLKGGKGFSTISVNFTN